MLKFSSSTNSILSSSPCSQPGIQLNDLWWAWSTLPSMPSANGFQRASARILPCGNKSGDNANLPCIWLGINRKGSRAKLRLWEQGWTVVRVNAGCKGCVKPSTSLKEENKIIFKISHEAKNLYKQLAKTPVQALPKAWHISKGFYSKGFAVGVPIAEDSCKPNPCRLDIKTLQGKKKKKVWFQAACCTSPCPLKCAKSSEAERPAICHYLHGIAAGFTFKLSPSQHHTQCLLFSGADQVLPGLEKAKY